MAKAQAQKYWYYVAVLKKDHIALVTEVEYHPHKVAHWDLNKKPLALSRNYAQQLALGLCLNGNQAYTIISLWELDNQLYRKEDEE